MTAYVYYSYEEFGRGYIGARSKSPDGDDYFGSFKDTTFKPTNKIILAEFGSMEEALEVEVALHNYFDVAENPHFANRAKQTTAGWTTAGVKQTEEHRKKCGDSRRGSKNPMANPVHRRTAALTKIGDKNPMKKPENRKIHKEAINRPEVIEKRKSKIWINNGTECVLHNKNFPIPQGWRKGRGFIWVTDGVENKTCPLGENIPAGWRRGRTIKGKKLSANASPK